MKLDADQLGFLDRACTLFPGLKKFRDEEFIEDYGDASPYGFLGCVARHALDQYKDSDEQRYELQRLLNFLEEEYARGSESVREIIHLGFLENLGGPPEPGWRIRELLGPQLSKTIEKIWPSTGYTQRFRKRH